MAARQPARPDPHRLLRQLTVHRRAAERMAIEPAALVVGPRPQPIGAGALRHRPGRGLVELRPRREGHAHPRRRRAMPPGDRAAAVRRLDERGPRARVAHRRRPRLPPHDPVPARPPEGLARAAHVRRPAVAGVAGGGGRHVRAAHRRRSRGRARRTRWRTPPTSGSMPRSSAWPIPTWPAPVCGCSTWPSRRCPRPVSTAARYHLVDAYAERWVRQGRSPADDRLDAWRLTGELFPPAESLSAALAIAEPT